VLILALLVGTVVVPGTFAETDPAAPPTEDLGAVAPAAVERERPAFEVAPSPEPVRPEPLQVDEPQVKGFDARYSRRIDARTNATTELYQNADGSMTGIVSPRPVRFKDNQGRWQEIDTSAVGDKDGAVRSRRTLTQARLRVEDRRPLVELPTIAGAIEMREESHSVRRRANRQAGRQAPDGSASADAELQGPRARLAAESGRSLDYKFTNFGVKEDIVLDSVGSSSTFQVSFRLPPGLSAREGKGRIEFVNTSGTVIAFYEGGYAFDEVAQRVPDQPAPEGTATPVVVQLVRTVGRNAVVRVGVDQKWFTAPDRAFPVVIDPMYEITRNPGVDDTYVNSDNPNGVCDNCADGRYVTQAKLRIGDKTRWTNYHDGVTNPVGNAIIMLPITDIPVPPTGYVYDNAYLKLWNVKGITTPSGYPDPNCSSQWTVSRIQSPWDPWTITYSSMIGLFPSLPPSGVPIDGEPYIAPYTSDEYRYLNAKETVREKLNGQPFYGLGIGVSVHGSALCGFRAFSSYQGGTPPLLYIQYQPDPSVPPTPPADTPSDLGSTLTQPTEADPVNVVTGNMVDTFVDHASPEQVFGLEWARTYNLLDSTSPGSMGRGWSSSFSPTISAVTGGVEMVAPDGRHVKWTGSPGSFTRPNEFPADLSLDSGAYRVTFDDGTAWEFDVLGRLLKLRDTAGHTVTVTRDPSSGQLLTASGQGVTLTFTYGTSGSSAGKITSVVGPTGTVGYGYDPHGNLETVSDVGGNVTTYHYDANDYLDQITDPEGVHVLTNTFDGEHRVATQTNASGAVTTFAYKQYVAGSNPPLWTSTMQDSITGPQGAITYYFDDQLRVVRVKDSLPTSGGGSGNFADREYDTSLDNIKRTVSRINGEQRFTYAPGTNRLTCVAGPGGSCPTTSSLSSGTGPYTAYHYDGGRVDQKYVNGEGLTTYSYTAATDRAPHTVTDANGRVTTYVVVDGVVTSETDSDGVTTSYVYDSDGRLVSQTDGVGNTTTFAYDGAGHLRCTAMPGATCPAANGTGGSGRYTTTTYNTDGRVASTRATDGGVTSYTYDDAGRVETTTDPTGATTTNHYGQATGLLVAVDKPGTTATPTNTWTYAYDGNGNRYCEAKPGGSCPNAAGVGGAAPFTFTKYGALGRVEYTLNELGQKTSYLYDATGNQTEVQGPDGGVTKTEYDVAGRVTKTIDETGRFTTTRYDQYGRVTCVASPGGNCDTASGPIATTTYDSLGRVASETTKAGAVTSYTYTFAGRLKTVTSPLGAVTTTTYDAAGRSWKSTNHIGAVTTTTYDQFGEVATVTSPTGLVTAYTYDPGGRQATITDPAGVVTTRTYSYRGELLTEQTGTQGTVRYAYNPDSSILGVADALTPPPSPTQVVGPLHRQGWDVVPDGTVPWTFGTGPGAAPAGAGSLQFGPIDGSVAANKFVAKGPSVGLQVSALTDVSWKLYVDPASAKGSEHLYANIYVDLADNGLGTFQRGFYDCRYDLTTPANLAKGVWHTRTYTPSTAVPYTNSVAAPCPATLAGAAGGSTILSFVLNGGQSTASDAGLIGAFDAVAFTTSIGNRTYDFEPEDGVVPRITSYSYDSRGNRVGRTNALGKTEAWTYDDADELLSHVDQLNRQTVHTYANNPTDGRKETVTDGSGRTMTTETNLDGTVKRAVFSGVGSPLTYTYSYNPANGFLTSIADGAKTWGYQFDAAGRMTGTQHDPAAGANGWTTYGYSSGGTRTSVDGTNYTYDALGRLTKVAPAPTSTGPVGTMSAVTPTLANYPWGMAVDASGAMYWTDRWDHKVYKRAPNGTTTLFAGTGTPGYTGDGGPATSATVTGPGDIEVDAAGNVYFIDIPFVRKVTPAGIITTVAGNGNYGFGGNGGPATSAPLDSPSAIALDAAGNLYVAEDGGSDDGGIYHPTIRKVDVSGIITLYAGIHYTYSSGYSGDGGDRLAAGFDHIFDLRSANDGSLLVTGGGRVRKIAPSGVVSTVIGSGTYGSSGDGGPATSAQLGLIGGVALDAVGNTYVSDLHFNRVRKVDGAGIITTVAGTGVDGSTGDGGPATAAKVGAPSSLAYSPSDGSVYLVDVTGSRIRKFSVPTPPPADIATYTYDLEDRVTGETLVGGSRTYTYGLAGSGTGAGRLVGFTQSLPGANVSTTLTYDTTGRIATEVTNGVTTTYGYDAAGQLTSATPSAGSATTWTYDELGRRATETVGSALKTYRYDDASQLCWIATGPSSAPCGSPPSGATAYAYDAAGRRLSEATSGTDSVTYAYDVAGRLATMARLTASGMTTQSRAYDADSRISSVTNTSSGPPSSTSFAWDKALPVPQLRRTGGTTLVSANGRWAAAISGPTTTAVPTDLYGSVLSTGPTSLGRSGSYTAWGVPAGAGTPEPKLGYRGELALDGLTDLRARQYDPSTGAFTSKDPIDGVDGTTTLGQGLSYSYAGNDPLGRVDPTGMQSDDAFKTPGDGDGLTPKFCDISNCGPKRAQQLTSSEIMAIRPHLNWISVSQSRVSESLDLVYPFINALSPTVNEHAMIIATILNESGFDWNSLEGINKYCPGYDGGCEFRGRGLGHLTGEANYQRFGGKAFVKNPELARSRDRGPAVMMKFWAEYSGGDLRRAGQAGDVRTVTRIYRGAAVGDDLTHRACLFNRTKAVLSGRAMPGCEYAKGGRA
jgi:RHS repeat-associated protein